MKPNDVRKFREYWLRRDTAKGHDLAMAQCYGESLLQYDPIAEIDRLRTALEVIRDCQLCNACSRVAAQVLKGEANAPQT